MRSVCEPFPRQELHGIDYIMYPSVQNSGYSCNLAFQPNLRRRILPDSIRFISFESNRTSRAGATLEVLDIADYMMNKLLRREAY